jgi:hypothetical protein
MVVEEEEAEGSKGEEDQVRLLIPKSIRRRLT